IKDALQRRSELERLKRIALANLPARRGVPRKFNRDVERFIARSTHFPDHAFDLSKPNVRPYSDARTHDRLPEVSPADRVIIPGVPALAVAHAFVVTTATLHPTADSGAGRGRPASRQFRCLVGLLIEAWQDLFGLPA